MKLKIFTLSIFTVVLTTVSCSKDNDDKNTVDALSKEYTYTSEKFDLGSILDSKLGEKATNRTSSESIIYETIITSNIEVPESATEEDIDEIIDNNIDNVNGVITHQLDGRDFIKITYVDGEESIEFFDLNVGRMSGDCTYDAIQDCAQDIVYGQGTWSKLRCAFSGGSCILDAAIDCTIDNCFGGEDE